MPQRRSYEAIMETIDGYTNPELGIGEKLGVWMSGDPVTPFIAAIREAEMNLRYVCDNEIPHDPECGDLEIEMGDTLRKLRKNASRLISDYARHLDKLQDCGCQRCRKMNAANN